MISVLRDDFPDLIDRASRALRRLDGKAPASPAWPATDGASSRRTALVAIEEPSTRTRVSIFACLHGLGVMPIAVENFLAELAVAKGERVSETIASVSDHLALIAIRSRHDGLPAYVAEESIVPVINLGDGCNEHPTQALGDLVAASLRLGSVEGRHLVLFGDLALNRCAHSVFLAAAQLRMRISLVAGASDELPLCLELIARDLGITGEKHSRMQSVRGNVDVLYVARDQHERRSHKDQVKRLQSDELRLRPSDVARAKTVLMPLPRGRETADDVWDMVKASVWDQARMVHDVREWLVCQLLEGLDDRGSSRFLVPADAVYHCEQSANCVGTERPCRYLYRLSSDLLCSRCMHRAVKAEICPSSADLRPTSPT